VKLTIPNILTLFRLATAPLFLAVFVGSAPNGVLSSFLSPCEGLILCLLVVILSETSDVLDGILARRWGQVSNFGKLMDPYADSAFRLSCFFAFAGQAHGKWIPLWMAMVLFYRDLLTTVIRAFGVEQGKFVAARASGKIKAITQGTVVAITLVVAIWHGPEFVDYKDGSAVARSLMWVVTAVTLWSAADYFWGNRHLFYAEADDGAKATSSNPFHRN
jgi:CDP-diacylglycerol--glycerol-3-phosphate 3-phosphatidyltransferase